jgi:hypothetical protein
MIVAQNSNAAVAGSTDGLVTGASYHTMRAAAYSFDFSVASTSCPLPSATSDPDCTITDPTQTLPVHMNAASLTTDVTQYLCQVFNFPSNTDYQVLKFHPYIENANVVHHILLYGCDTTPSQTGTFECSSMPSGCNAITYAWAVGVGDLCVPEGVGVPFGANSNSVFVMQVHYNNAAQQSGIGNSSCATCVLRFMLTRFSSNSR